MDDVCIDTRDSQNNSEMEKFLHVEITDDWYWIELVKSDFHKANGFFLRA